jgi:hypothetical protein
MQGDYLIPLVIPFGGAEVGTVAPDERFATPWDPILAMSTDQPIATYADAAHVFTSGPATLTSTLEAGVDETYHVRVLRVRYSPQANYTPPSNVLETIDFAPLHQNGSSLRYVSTPGVVSSAERRNTALTVRCTPKARGVSGFFVHLAVRGNTVNAVQPAIALVHEPTALVLRAISTGITDDANALLKQVHPVAPGLPTYSEYRQALQDLVNNERACSTETHPDMGG